MGRVTFGGLASGGRRRSTTTAIRHNDRQRHGGLDPYHLGNVVLTVGSGNNANSYTVTGNIVDWAPADR